MNYELLKFVTQDESWLVASRLVQLVSGSPSPAWRSVKMAWSGGSTEDLIRAMSLAKIPSKTVINAAKGVSGVETSDLAGAVNQMGSRFTSVVLATSIAFGWVRRQSKDPTASAQLIKEILTCVETGYIIGTKVPSLGSHGGALMGLAIPLGEALVAGYAQVPIRKWWSVMPRERKQRIKTTIGCDAFQVGSLALQSLGFGVEIATGVLLSQIKAGVKVSTIPPTARAWQSAFLWTESLRYGRNYPSTKEAQTAFRELTPPEPGSGNRNLTLETLYAELSSIRSNGSTWTWHQ